MKGETTFDHLTGNQLTEWQKSYGISEMGREHGTISKHFGEVRKKGRRYYHWRVWLLIFGFVALVASKVVAPYLDA